MWPSGLLWCIVEISISLRSSFNYWCILFLTGYSHLSGEKFLFMPHPVQRAFCWSGDTWSGATSDAWNSRTNAIAQRLSVRDWTGLILKQTFSYCNVINFFPKMSDSKSRRTKGSSSAPWAGSSGSTPRVAHERNAGSSQPSPIGVNSGASNKDETQG